eukprot:gene8895-9812_t
MRSYRRDSSDRNTRSRSRSRSRGAGGRDRRGGGGGGDDTSSSKKKKKVVVDGEEGIDDDEEEEEEQLEDMLGFTGFGSTKGKAVSDNQQGAAAGAVSKHKARKYRQYMNRKGGFNRPLQKMD